jgi:phage portal protein BeeE
MRASGVKRSVQEQAALGITYSCLQRRAQSVASSWEKVYSERTQSDKKEVPLDHWLVRLLWKPNAYYTRSQIRKLTAYWLDINGNAFIHTPIIGGKPASMWVLRPSRVKIILDATSMVAGYEVQNSGSSILVPPNEMIHLRDMYASDADEYQIYGRGIIQALRDQLSLDGSLGQYLSRYFDNDARPPFVAKIDGDFDGDWEAFRNTWNTKNPNMKLRGLLKDGIV